MGEWQPVENASRKMTAAEVRYAMIENQALGITWACEKFENFLVGRAVEIETDHKPLIALLGEKDLSQLPLRVQYFKHRLMRYDYTIFHNPGNQMYLADSLSRPNSMSVASVECIRSCDSVEEFDSEHVGNLDARDAELRRALKEDTTYQRCRVILNHGWPEDGGSLGGELLELYNSSRNVLTVCNGLKMYGSHMYLPAALRISYLHESVSTRNDAVNPDSTGLGTQWVREFSTLGFYIWELASRSCHFTDISLLIFQSNRLLVIVIKYFWTFV